ncbi:hypothetical protein MJO28_017624 [Puccinia striiformis f. sp. tritici]|nr:hypothetical protein Pst134EA_005528 [Puccinia striiformis f. sp. tritici]KAH9471644.1 hypothetical protein Pst134EA_005528 [Puccinia striiformis f. sp. tritici]KAI7933484.1 hypothetical protein MJO28_017624 [Puccinia striiformis f. sp. tritici]KAI7964484.1 hypothetical protein MJO29_002582 [Puccinia striiformis f. sp. tritici]
MVNSSSNFIDLTQLSSPSPPPPHSSSPCYELPTEYSKRAIRRRREAQQQQQQHPQADILVISDDEEIRPARQEQEETTARQEEQEDQEEECPSSPSTTDQAELERTLIRFLPTDLKLLNIYLCKPISTVITTCSSLLLPPVQIPGLPLDQLETLYANDPWRIKWESIPGNHSQNISCWIYGPYWPAKSFIISGWLVGIDRREKFITYHIDDGTAVLECQVNISQLATVFDTSTEEEDFTNIPFPKEEKKKKEKEKNVVVEQHHQEIKKAEVDTRLDPYRRLPEQQNKPGLHTTSSTTTKTEPITEEMITRYTDLEIGTVLRLIGKPKSLFRDTKRILDVDKAWIIHVDHQSNHEIRFRNHLRFCRSKIYGYPFRLVKICPELVQNHSTVPIKNNDQETQKTESEIVIGPKTSNSNKKLKLIPVSKLNPNQINFKNYLNYLSHYIITKYDDQSSHNNEEEGDYHDYKRKMMIPENNTYLDLVQFSIDDLLSEINNTTQSEKEEEEGDRETRKLGQELNKFTEKLITQSTTSSSSTPTSEEKNRPTKPRSIFLTGGEEKDSVKKKKMIDTKKSILTRGIKTLINQGLTIISPKDERQFTVPNLDSLGPKLIQIIHQLTSVDDDHCRDQGKQKKEVGGVVSCTEIIKILHFDLLWKFVNIDTVIHVLNLLKLVRIGPDSWRIPACPS